jgi:D-alanyl-D-alanine carboxypeptidase
MPPARSKHIQISHATPSELGEIHRLFNTSNHLPDRHNPSLLQIIHPDDGKLKSRLADRISDRCLLAARQQGELIAAIGLDLDSGSISEFFVPVKKANGHILIKMVDRIERLAVQFGLMDSTIVIPKSAVHWFKALAYLPSDMSVAQKSNSSIVMKRLLTRRQTDFGRLVADISNDLGISGCYGKTHRLALQAEPTRLKNIGPDLYQREQKMTPAAAKAWLKMKTAAGKDDIALQVVSAFRSVQYQKGLLQRKLQKGQEIEHILKVSAAPGFSEHHTGRAVDITTPGFAVLEEEFEQSPAFRWLQSRASHYSFYLSFPRNNRHHLSFEPWHWCFHSK